MIDFDFPHTPPDGYSYEQTEFKRNVIAIWILNHSKFSYNGGRITRSIWGFYNSKTKCYHAPINSKTIGNKIDINRTSLYSAMTFKQTPLESAFV